MNELIVMPSICKQVFSDGTASGYTVYVKDTHKHYQVTKYDGGAIKLIHCFYRRMDGLTPKQCILTVSLTGKTAKTLLQAINQHEQAN